MRCFFILLLLVPALCVGPFVATGQEMDPTEAPEILAPTPAKVQLWTDKLGYNTGEQMSARLSLDPMGDTTEYKMFLYRENFKTAERKYIDTLPVSNALRDEVSDVLGMSGELITAHELSAAEGTVVWTGGVPVPGLWQFVAELRSADTTQVLKTAYAKFAVTQEMPTVLGGDGMDTEISTDTTWTNDKIYKIKHQVFVNAGATLTIEAGTLIVASGQIAVIVVEKGGKIMADGRRELPIVMTCDADVGVREPGCWGGLVVLGSAPTNHDEGTAEGVTPETRAVYGGDDPMDSSGVLRYVRVEFAGVDFNDDSQANAFGFHGVGAGTVIDHIQAHEGADDGIEFLGGTANCTYCVSSGSKDDSLGWAFGWTGTAQNVFVLQDASQGDRGIEADNNEEGQDSLPRSHPQLWNVTMVGGLAHSAVNSSVVSNQGIVLRLGTAVTGRNILVTGFGGVAVDVMGNSPGLFTDGTSSITNAIIHDNGGRVGDAQINGGVEALVEYMDVDPMLVNIRYEANPDPRPMAGSYAFTLGASSTPPSDGTLDTGALCVGAFCNGENWLEEWTFFGDEDDYDFE